MKKCECNMRTKLVGDGCRVCNPEYLIGILECHVEELELELDSVEEQKVELAEKLREMTNMYESAVQGDC